MGGVVDRFLRIMKGQYQGQTKGPDKTGDSIRFFGGLIGLVAILCAGVLIPIKAAEMFFGYSIADEFWQVTETTQSSDEVKTRR